MADITSNLGLWWQFDDGSGTSAADSSGNSKNGTLVNTPTWTTAKIGTSALTLASASSQYGHNTSLSGFTVGTLACWMKRSGSQGAFARPLEIGGAGTSRVGMIFLTGTTLVAQTLGQTFNGGAQTTSSAVSITDATWAHVVVTWSATALNMYVDNAAPVTIAGDFTLPSHTKIFAGAYITGPSNYFNGSLDDLRLYSRVFDSTDVAALYAYTGAGIPFEANMNGGFTELSGGVDG